MFYRDMNVTEFELFDSWAIRHKIDYDWMNYSNCQFDNFTPARIGMCDTDWKCYDAYRNAYAINTL